MKVLFFLAHPAHYHLFKNSIKQFRKNNLNPIVVIKSKDVLEKLLQTENIPYINILNTEKKRTSKLGLAFEAIKGLLIRDLKLLKIVQIYFFIFFLDLFKSSRLYSFSIAFQAAFTSDFACFEPLKL